MYTYNDDLKRRWKLNECRALARLFKSVYFICFNFVQLSLYTLHLNVFFSLFNVLIMTHGKIKYKIIVVYSVNIGQSPCVYAIFVDKLTYIHLCMQNFHSNLLNSYYMLIYNRTSQLFHMHDSQNPY